MANKKFSEFDLKTSSSDVAFVVGFNGSDNVRITPNNLRVAGGSDTEIQFNNSGALGGGSFLTTNKSNKLEVTYELGLKGDGGSNQGLLKLYCEAGTAHHVGIKGPAHSGGSSYTLQLPNTLPNVANQVLESNAAGTLSWIATPSGAGGVTSIIAGSGISVNQATGAVTVSASGGGGGASSLNGLSDVLIDGTSNYFVNIPAGLSGNPADNLIIGSNAGTDLTSGTENVIIGKDAGENLLAGTENTMLGVDAGTALTNGPRNTFLGNSAGFFTGNSIFDVIAIGYKAGTYAAAGTHIAIGREAGRNNSGNGRIDVGYKSGYSNSSGSWNLNIGYFAAYSNTTGGKNTVIGTEAGLNNTGSSNTFLGYQAGYNQTSSPDNTFIGHLAGRNFNNTSGDGRNVAVGSNAGNDLTTGIYNTFLGYEAGGFNTNITTGNFNVMVGYQAAGSGASASNQNSFGYSAASTGNNQVTLGNSSISALRCAVTSITSLSDERDKSEIKNLEYGLDFVDSLQPREFVWDNRPEIDGDGEEFYSANKGKKDFGFIAQEVKELDNDTLRLVYDENPEKLELSYGKLVPILVKAIQELKAEIELLKS